MATINGTIVGATCLSTSWRGMGSREAWLLTVEFATYNDTADDMSITGVGAAIDARARDGKASTLRSGVCAFAGRDAAATPVAVYALGASADALTVSGDGFTGELSNDAGTEIDATGPVTGVGVIAIVTRA